MVYQLHCYNTLYSWPNSKVKIYLIVNHKMLRCVTMVLAYRKVTSSSDDVGWMATVLSKSCLVAPILMATAKPCSISSHPWPIMCKPSTWKHNTISHQSPGREVLQWWSPFLRFSIRICAYFMHHHNLIDPLFLWKI